MPRSPYLSVEGRLLTADAFLRFQQAHRTGYLSYSRRSGEGLRSAWNRHCIRRGTPLAEVEQRRNTAELWIDIYPSTPSPCEFPLALQRHLARILDSMGMRDGSVSRHTVRAGRVPRHLAEVLMAELVGAIMRWLPTWRDGTEAPDYHV